MTLHPLPLAADAVPRERRSVATVCLAGVALLALGVFAFAEIVAAGEQGSAQSPSVPTLSPFVVLPTVPQASDVLPTAPTRPEPEIATYGG